MRQEAGSKCMCKRSASETRDSRFWIGCCGKWWSWRLQCKGYALASMSLLEGTRERVHLEGVEGVRPYRGSIGMGGLSDAEGVDVEVNGRR